MILRTVASYLHSSAGTWLYLSCGHRVLRDSWCPGTGRVPCAECAAQPQPGPAQASEGAR